MDLMRKKTTAFSLVELLVVIAVLGILLSMVLPAVQSARESARLTACKNNLRQIGIALHNFHDSHGELPMGCLEWRASNRQANRRQLAWSAFLLPQLEQRNLFRSLDFEQPFDAPANATGAATRLSVYECPTVPLRDLERGRIDYGGLFGERIVSREPDDGLFLYDQIVRFKDVIDGLSNTMAIAEDVGGPDSEWINGRNVFVQAHGINDPSAWIGDNEIRSRHPGGAMTLFADSHVAFMQNETDPVVLGSMITRNGGETISTDFN